MVTRAEVAKAAGVSTATVSRVLNNPELVSDDLKEKVHALIRDLKYRPNNIARNLAMNRSHMICVLVDEITNPYYTELIENMEEVARDNGYVLSTITVHKNMDDIVDDIIMRRVDGVINLTLFSCSGEKIDIMEDIGVKFTNFGSISQGSRILIEYGKAYHDYIRLLAEKNYKRLAFLAGMNESLASRDTRTAAYLKYRAEYGFDEDDRLLVYGNYPEIKSQVNGYEGVKYLIDNQIPFDSILCMNDLMALGTIHALTENGYKVPEDVAVVGCDNISISEFTVPSLSTIDVCKKQMSKIYIQDIISRIDGNGDEEYLLTPTIIPRKSVRQ